MEKVKDQRNRGRIPSNARKLYQERVTQPPFVFARPSCSHTPLFAINNAKSGKVTKHRHFVRAAGRNAQFIPVPVSVLGGWRSSEYAYVAAIADTIASRAMVPKTVARARCFQRHAARLVQDNVRCLEEAMLREI